MLVLDGIITLDLSENQKREVVLNCNPRLILIPYMPTCH
jgi:hypothetical protein